MPAMALNTITITPDIKMARCLIRCLPTSNAFSTSTAKAALSCCSELKLCTVLIRITSYNVCYTKLLRELTAEGKKVRVVSMPATDVFDKQDAAYRESVLPAAVTTRVAVRNNFV